MIDVSMSFSVERRDGQTDGKDMSKGVLRSRKSVKTDWKVPGFIKLVYDVILEDYPLMVATLTGDSQAVISSCRLKVDSDEGGSSVLAGPAPQTHVGQEWRGSTYVV
jgi:hypothetical protein